MSETSAISTSEVQKHKRQTEFHTIFKSIPDGEMLLECKNPKGVPANAYRDIVSVDKRNTAVIFPNAIQIATLHHRYFFASFVYREEAYKQLQGAWKRVILGTESGRDIDLDEDIDMIGDDFLVEMSVDNTLNTFEGPSVGTVPIQCGCDFHFAIEGLSAIINMPLSALYSTLLDPRSRFLPQFYQSFSMHDCEVGEWSHQLSGGEQRIIRMKMPLPRILADTGHSMITSVEKFLLNQPARRFITETVTEILNVPGGVCRVMSRMCMTMVDQERSHIFISFDAFPSKGAFFKESVRISLVIHFSELYTALGVALAEHSKIEGSQVLPRRSLSWFRRRKLDKGASMRRTSSTSSFESYFDFAAFVRSLFWLFILLAICSSVLYERLYRRASNPQEIPEDYRVQLIQNVQRQLAEYLEGLEKQEKSTRQPL